MPALPSAQATLLLRAAPSLGPDGRDSSCFQNSEDHSMAANTTPIFLVSVIAWVKSAIFHGASVKRGLRLACQHCPTLDRTTTSLLHQATSCLLWSNFQWPSQTITVFDRVPRSPSRKVSSPRQRSLPSTRVSKRRWYPQISSTRRLRRQLDPPSHAVESCCCATADIKASSLSVGTPLHGESKSLFMRSPLHAESTVNNSRAVVRSRPTDFQ